MKVVLVAVCLAALYSSTQAKPPAGYILQLTHECGASNSATATIKLVTDLDASAKAMCSGADVNFTSTDGVNFELDVAYPTGSGDCIFMKRQDAEVYFVTVSISYGEEGQHVHQNEEEFTVTCTFTNKGDDDTGDQTIVDALIAPTEKVNNEGADSSSTFTLELCDVLGGSLDGVDLALGRTVQLKGTTSSAESESGLRPVSCFAIDGDARYAILRAGCGDGIIFGKDEGFRTSGNTTLSPYFKAYSINSGVIVKFECTFVICTGSACDGCSCALHRDS